MKVLPANPSPLSIVVPTLNEAGNLANLIRRIHKPLYAAAIPYEIIIIDDHSSDKTRIVAQSLKAEYPDIKFFSKMGKPGKAYSLLEGFDRAEHALVCMIDADLQYPPEAIVPMYRKLHDQSVDVVITERVQQKTTWLRKFLTRGYNLVFTRLLFGINFDSQSGLKLFKKQILSQVSLNPSPWSFDLEFIIRSLEHGYKIVSHSIVFADRTAGEPKIHIVSTSFELAKASLKLRFKSSRRQVKSTYRESLRISAKPITAVAMAFVIAATGIGGFHGNVAALDLPAAVSNATAPVMSIAAPIVNPPTETVGSTVAPVINTVLPTIPVVAPTPAAETQPAAIMPPAVTVPTATSTVPSTPVVLPSVTTPVVTSPQTLTSPSTSTPSWTSSIPKNTSPTWTARNTQTASTANWATPLASTSNWIGQSAAITSQASKNPPQQAGLNMPSGDKTNLFAASGFGGSAMQRFQKLAFISLFIGATLVYIMVLSNIRRRLEAARA